MLFRDVIDLIDVVTGQNAQGQFTESETTTSNIFANVKSVRQSEFYQALASNLRPEIAFEIRTVDYSEQKRLSYNSNKYEIIRTYSKNQEITELICQKIVLGG